MMTEQEILETKAACLDRIKAWLMQGATIKKKDPEKECLVVEADGVMYSGLIIDHFPDFRSSR